jgi:3'(2'), 5'-bisphosphate nucleotidase
VEIGKYYPLNLPVRFSPLPHLDLATDILKIATQIAWEATDLLRAFYRGADLQVMDKAGEPVTNADLAVNQHITDRLHQIFGDSCGYLTEETYQYQQAARPEPWVWIIDPIDGTKEFINRTGEYAVHIALTYQQRPILAVVALPEAEKVYQAVQGGGTYIVNRQGQRQKLQVNRQTTLPELIVIASRSHRSAALEKILAQLPCPQQIQVGSVGGKIAAIIEQRADVYISQSATSAPKDWDLAAPELILTEAGGQFTHAHGQALRYNQADVSQWGCLVASSGQWHQQLCAFCLAATAEI